MDAGYRADWLSASRAIHSVSGLSLASRRAGACAAAAMISLFDDLIASPGSANRLMASNAHTFYFASRFLPRTERSAVITLYAFFRTLDDQVDEEGRSGQHTDRVADEIARWRAWFESDFSGTCPRPGIGLSLASVVYARDIPRDLFLAFLDGMASDVTPTTPTTFEDLDHYCYQVAGTVGLSMAHVFGSTSPAALHAAHQLGAAMQLTNILRDIGGDLARGRIYLPVAELQRAGLSPEQLEHMWMAGGGPDARLRWLIAELISRADDLYEQGVCGIDLLPAGVQLPILVATRLYQQILRELEANEYDSLRTRVATSRARKVSEAFGCLWVRNPATSADRAGDANAKRTWRVRQGQ